MWKFLLVKMDTQKISWFDWFTPILVIRIKRTFPNIVRACVYRENFLGWHFMYKQGYG